MKRTLLLLLIAVMSINFAYPANNEKEEFMQLYGLGEISYDSYGQVFINAIKKFDARRVL